MKLRHKLSWVLLGAGLFLQGCQQPFQTLESTSAQSIESIGCTDFVSFMYDSVANEVVRTGLVPESSAVVASYQEALQSVDRLSPAAQKKLIDEITVMSQVLEQSLKTENEVGEILEKLATLSQKTGSTSEEVQAQNILVTSEKNVNQIFTQNNVSCKQVAEVDIRSSRLPASQKVSESTDRLLSVYFQSCQAPQLRPLVAADPGLRGIRTECTPGVVGCKRFYEDIGEILESHPYIEERTPDLARCANVRAKPPIYDFGGRPTMDNNRGRLNFFENFGPTTAMGIDCSAYVASIYVSSGLRLQPGRNPRAMDVNTSTSSMLNWTPQNSCFNPVVQTSGSRHLEVGDIILWRGHVVLVDTVGADPFGISRAQNISDCDRLNPARFNFTVSQSSPYKSGLGVQRSVAADYFSSLGATSLGRTAVMAYARAACRTRFTSASQNPKTSELVILRHKGTPECINSSEAIGFAYESCVSSCSL